MCPVAERISLFCDQRNKREDSLAPVTVMLNTMLSFAHWFFGLLAVQLFHHPHLEKQCCGDHVSFMFILRNIATLVWFSTKLLKHVSHLYLTWETLHVSAVFEKSKRTRNLPQLSLELDVFVDMSERESLNLVQGPKTDQVPALRMFWYTGLNGNN